MNCPQCNNPVRDGAAFCPSCGFRVGTESAPPATVKTRPKRDKNWVLFGGVLLLAAAAWGISASISYYHFKRAANLAQVYRDLGQFESCAEQYRIIVHRTPKDVKARLNAAECLMLARNYLEASNELDEALKWKRDQDDVYAHLGQLYYLTHKYRQARTALNQALKRNPRHRYAHQYMGLTLEKLTRDAEAIKQLRVSLGGAGKKDQILIGLHLGDIYARNQDYDKAVEAYRKVLDLDGNNFDGAFQLSRTYLAQGDFKNAIVYGEIALRLHPTDKQVKEQLDDIRTKNQRKLDIEYLVRRIPLDNEYISIYNDFRGLINAFNMEQDKYLAKPFPAGVALVNRAKDLENKYQALEPSERYYEQNAVYMANAALLRRTVEEFENLVESGDKNRFDGVYSSINALTVQNQRMVDMLEAEKKNLLGGESATGTAHPPSGPATGTATPGKSR